MRRATRVDPPSHIPEIDMRRLPRCRLTHVLLALLAPTLPACNVANPGVGHS